MDATEHNKFIIDSEQHVLKLDLEMKEVEADFLAAHNSTSVV